MKKMRAIEPDNAPLGERSGNVRSKSRRSPDGLAGGIKLDMVTVLDHMLDDMAGWLPEVDLAKAKYRLVKYPEHFRDFVNSMTLKAESHLAWGGFEAYACWRQVQSMIKKNIDWFACTPMEREKRAIDGYLANENTCKEANTRLRAARAGQHKEHSAPVRILNLARIRIKEILGPLTQSVYLDCLAKADFGPGAPYLVGNDWSEARNIYWKISGTQTVTRRALPHLILALELNDAWKQFLVERKVGYDVVDEGKIASVDKNAEINRVIEGQPSMCVWLQKGAGTVMADILLRIGIDLSSQARNRRAARKGSVDGKTATVDMTSASDLNARALIEWLFPHDWFEFLDDLAVHWGKLPGGQIVRHEMFSSMGNATTFAIECIVFYAIAWASCVVAGEDTRSIRVYGDDLVVPIGALGLVFETLLFCGHKPNVEKTHVFGPFRESCGRDYVNGIDVRPVYLDHVPSMDMEVMSLHNRLALMAMMPLPRTLKYLRNLGRDLTGPPDLGASYDIAMDALSGSMQSKRAGQGGRTKMSTEARVIALAVDSYYVVDPPPPSGFCSSYQSNFWSFRGYTQRSVALEGADDEEVKWRAVLYGAQLLGSTKGSVELSALRVPSQQTKTFVPEKYCFWWSSVDLVRTALWKHRL